MTLPAYQGIYPMILSFYGGDGELDTSPIAKQIEAFIKHGAHGVAVLGLATEINKLSLAERHQVVEASSLALQGRLPFSVTVGENSVKGQISFAKTAKSSGANWLILQPPPVTGISELELQRFFGSVADQIDIPIAIQNAPDYLGIGLSLQGIAELHQQHPNICIVKIEDDALAISPLLDATGGKVGVFVGRGGLGTPDLLRAGAVGIIPGAESFDRLVGVFEAMQDNDEAEAETTYGEIESLLVFLEGPINQFVTYSRELIVRRLGLTLPVHHRLPSPISPFGIKIIERVAKKIGPL